MVLGAEEWYWLVGVWGRMVWPPAWQVISPVPAVQWVFGAVSPVKLSNIHRLGAVSLMSKRCSWALACFGWNPCQALLLAGAHIQP